MRRETKGQHQALELRGGVQVGGCPAKIFSPSVSIEWITDDERKLQWLFIPPEQVTLLIRSGSTLSD